MKSFILRSVVFLSVSFLALIAYGYFCEWFFLENKFLPQNSKRYWAMKLQNGNYDYAVLGSSRGEGAFDLNQLDSLTGLNGVNISANGSGYVDNYLVLTKFLQNGNRIKYLFLQTDIYSLDPEGSFSNAFHVYNFAPYYGDSIYKNAIDHYLSVEDQTMFHYLPLLRFYKYNKYFSPVQIVQRYKQSKGGLKRPDLNVKSDSVYTSITNVDSSRFLKNAGSKYLKVNSFDLRYFHKIIELTKQNNIKLVCFTVPDFHFQKKIYSNYIVVQNDFYSNISKLGILHILPPSDISKDIKCFHDPAHINEYGRFYFTKYFSESLNQSLQLIK
jgi:hypothetical protein